MKQIFYLLIAVSLFIISCKENTQKVTESNMSGDIPGPSIEKLWETDPVFITAESAIYDPETDMVYVSNIEGEPWGEDGIGSIGKMTLEGKIIEAKWVTGLNAPKGMGISHGKLYVADLINLVEIDLETGKQMNVYTVKEAEGLNDITTDNEGRVYVSDSQIGAVFMMKNGTVTKVIGDLAKSNGILFEQGDLVIGTWNDEKLNRYNLETGNMTTIADSIFQPDGIEAVGDGSYLVTSWSGMIHHVDSKGNVTTLSDTRLDSISAADLDYIQDKSLLLVPTFYKNSITAYELKK